MFYFLFFLFNLFVYCIEMPSSDEDAFVSKVKIGDDVFMWDVFPMLGPVPRGGIIVEYPGDYITPSLPIYSSTVFEVFTPQGQANVTLPVVAAASAMLGMSVVLVVCFRPRKREASSRRMADMESDVME
eukprot:Trichotokara_eunicae@DN3208_c0_g1_i1.p1